MNSKILEKKRTEYKKIHGDIWKFDFKENGYVCVAKVEGVEYLNAIDLGTCLGYVFAQYEDDTFLVYDELETVDIKINSQN